MQLTREACKQLQSKTGLQVPADQLFELPEKILQFGTGVLLRALPDYFVDKANKQGIFNGRIVVVKSTESDSTAFDLQNGLYTVCVRGIENGKSVEENIINAAVSRVLSAKSEWQIILKCAYNPDLKVVISNTTEVGIQLVEDNIQADPPVSFPGKLLAFLYERFKAFGGTPESGLVIVPTELITDNGTKLESIVLELAHLNKLEFAFIEWLEQHNTFCNSLVDRIVPGKPNVTELKKLKDELGYTDHLLTMSEVFRLWAIEGDEKVKEVLSFAQVDPAVVIASDITLFKELKLRLLNGTHTFNCGISFLGGFNITREVVQDDVFGRFTKALMHKEIAPAIPFDIPVKQKEDFANSTFDRFCNPAIDHQLLSITVQYTSKMKMRNLPLIQRHYELGTHAPQRMAAGFAAFLLFMKATRKEENKYFGERNGVEYEIKDDSAAYFYEVWQQYEAAAVPAIVMQNTALWEVDLTQYPGFLAAVQEQFNSMLSKGVAQTVAELENANVAL